MATAENPEPETEITNEVERLFAHKVHSYTRYYGNWKHIEEIMFFTVRQIIEEDSLIFKMNPSIIRELKPETGEEWRAALEAMTPDGNDRHFPRVRFNGGMHILTEEEYHQAVECVENEQKSINGVIDLNGIFTTPDAEFDRAIIYESVNHSKRLIEAYEATQASKAAYEAEKGGV